MSRASFACCRCSDVFGPKSKTGNCISTARMLLHRRISRSSWKFSSVREAADRWKKHANSVPQPKRDVERNDNPATASAAGRRLRTTILRAHENFHQFMKAIHILSLGCLLLICATALSGCATPHQSSPLCQESKSDSDDLTGPQKVGSYFLSFLESVAYGLGESGYSFTP